MLFLIRQGRVTSEQASTVEPSLTAIHLYHLRIFGSERFIYKPSFLLSNEPSQRKEVLSSFLYTPVITYEEITV